MRHAVAAEAIEMIGDGLACARQHQRRVPERRAQKDLQTAIAADVVERAPYDRAVRCFAADRRGQAGEAVDGHFRHARGARREQHPFGFARRRGKICSRHDVRRARNPQRNIERSARGRIGIDDNSIDLGTGDDGCKMIGIGVGRQNGEAARDAVKLDQRQRGGELAAGGDQDRFSRQFVEPAAK
jgi:hypothetical protein